MGQGGTPTNEVLTTIGTAKDHADIVTWEAATDEDCTAGWGAGIYADPCSPVGKVYDTGDFTDNLTITGATTDSTHYRRVTVAAGERHSGDYPKVDGGAKSTGYVLIDEDYAEVEWLIVDAVAQSEYSHVNVSTGQDVLLRNIIAEAGSSQYAAFKADPGNGKNTVFENCIGITRRTSSATVRVFIGGYQDGVKYRNCTALAYDNSDSTTGFRYGEPTNCIAIVGASDTAYGSSEGSGNYNISSDETAPGATHVYNVAAADLFMDVTDTAEDLHLKDDNTAASGVGTDLSAYFTDDIDGDTRSDWDIGADEFAGAGSVELVVGNSECLVKSENVALTQHQVLSVDDSESVVKSETVSLVQHQTIAVAGSKSVVESGGVTFTQHHLLAVNNSKSVVESDSVSLTQHQALVVADSESVVESENISLTQHQVLVVANSECIVESEGVALTQHQTLSVDDSECVVTSGNVVLSFGTEIQPSFFLAL